MGWPDDPIPPARPARGVRPILQRRFRAGRDFTVVPLRDVPERFRPRVGGAAAAGQVVLLPRAPGPISAKVLGGGAARLIAELGRPGLLPGEIRCGRGPLDNADVARLVLSGALEIEHDGGFRSGPAAHPALFAPDADPAPGTETDRNTPDGGRLAVLSRRALRHAERLGLRDVTELSYRLYGYGVVPRSPRWDRVLGGPDDTLAVIGATAGGPAAAALSGYEAMVNPSWVAWSLDTSVRPELPYKLYVSPLPGHVADAFPVIATVLAAHGVWSFKIGRGAAGLLRPDKIVAYLPDPAGLRAVGTALAAALPGCPAHGVPFTADAAGDGLLSWGMDPPVTERLLDWRPQESWRLWVTNRLASAIVHAQASPGVAGENPDPVRFALDRLALDGVRPDTWSPVADIWSGARPPGPADLAAPA